MQMQFDMKTHLTNTVAFSLKLVTTDNQPYLCTYLPHSPSTLVTSFSNLLKSYLCAQISNILLDPDIVVVCINHQ